MYRFHPMASSMQQVAWTTCIDMRGSVCACVCVCYSQQPGCLLVLPTRTEFFSDFRYLFHSFCKRKYSNFGLRTSFPDRVKYFYTTVGYFFNMSFHEDALNRFFYTNSTTCGFVFVKLSSVLGKQHTKQEYCFALTICLSFLTNLLTSSNIL